MNQLIKKIAMMVRVSNINSTTSNFRVNVKLSEIVYIPGSIPDITEKISHVQSPTLVIWGDKDATLHPSSFPNLVEKLIDGQGQPIKGAGHQPHLTKPDLFNPLVLEFLENSRN